MRKNHGQPELSPRRTDSNGGASGSSRPTDDEWWEAATTWEKFVARALFDTWQAGQLATKEFIAKAAAGDESVDDVHPGNAR